MITQTAAYVVPFDALRRAAGSRDLALLEAISGECAGLLAEADLNRDDDDTRTCGKALADLINGEVPDDLPYSEGNIYGLALEAMCAHLGEFVSEVHGHWNEELDALFAARGVPLRFSDLVAGDEVLDLPTYADYPMVGSWSPEAVAAAAETLRAIDRDALRSEGEEMAEVVGEVARWVDQASKRPGWGVIGFSL